MNTQAFPVELVSAKYLARTFHQLPTKLVEQLRATGVEPVTRIDGVAFYPSTVVDRLRNQEPNK